MSWMRQRVRWQRWRPAGSIAQVDAQKEPRSGERKAARPAFDPGEPMDRNRIGIELISVLGMPPVEFAQFTARMGCGNMGIALETMYPDNPEGYPAWSMREDVALRRAFRSALDDNGVAISVGEGFLAWPHEDVSTYAADLDLMTELRAGAVNLLSIDPDLARALDQTARFAEMASERGLPAVLEYMPGMAIGNLSTATQAARHAGSDRLKVMVDTMHFFRSGSQPADLAATDPKLIGYVQVCDVPLVCKHESYGEEARFDRLAPGEGELPLDQFLAAVPDHCIVGLETPMMPKARAGIGAAERLGPAISWLQAI
ncbi:TIM barrel protein [Novosphingobium sp. PS1R-30]|uniref:TIM barrel protein n=1 Tax=Novosphingobium anseongense TaxID=3133436 RepID=A0ABU8RUD7_9SPHN